MHCHKYCKSSKLQFTEKHMKTYAHYLLKYAAATRAERKRLLHGCGTGLARVVQKLTSAYPLINRPDTRNESILC